MRAWLIDSYEGIDKLRLGKIPEPQPGNGQALLEVQLAAINPADAFLAQGLYPAKPPLPHILGRDGVGKVIAIGPDVDPAFLGKTFGILRGETGVTAKGTLAEKVVVPVSNLVAVPGGWTLEEMAGAPLVFLTAWQALTQWSDPPIPLTNDNIVLVTGASGGVGVAAVLLAKSMLCQVIALSRKEEKAAQLRALGADFTFNPEEPQLAKHILQAIAPKKVDLVVDNVGGKLFNEIISTLAYRGRISVVGRSGGMVPEFNTASLIFRRNRIGGVAVGDFTPETGLIAWKEIVRRLMSMGKKPIVDSIFPFEKVPAAFQRLAQGPMGKVIIKAL